MTIEPGPRSLWLQVPTFWVLFFAAWPVMFQSTFCFWLNMHREKGICFWNNKFAKNSVHLSIVLLWALSYIVCTSWFDISRNIARLLKYFPKNEPNAVLEINLLLATIFDLVFRNIDSGVVMSPTWRKIKNKIGLHIHAFRHKLCWCQKVVGRLHGGGKVRTF